jgi:Holliday junction resolvase RusA-like endonuclease
MPAFTIDVIGLPVPQGSLTPRGDGRGLRYPNEATLKPWRHTIMAELNAAKPDDWNPLAPVTISCTFRFPRNKGHLNKSGELLPSAPEHKMTAPDLDKLARAVGDSLQQSGLLMNDSQITGINASKRWALMSESPGLLLTVITL